MSKQHRRSRRDDDRDYDDKQQSGRRDKHKRWAKEPSWRHIPPSGATDDFEMFLLDEDVDDFDDDLDEDDIDSDDPDDVLDDDYTDR